MAKKKSRHNVAPLFEGTSTQDRILQSALKLFVKFGIRDVSLGSIFSHMKWTPVIALGYTVSMRVHLNINSGFDGIMP